jgi:ABC-type siderophore export system fused ATPase/permease subunit
MERLFHFLGSIFFLIWIVIGLVIIIGSVAAVVIIKNTDFSKFNPKNMMQEKTQQNDNQDEEITQEQIDCAKEKIGSERVEYLLKNNVEPSEEEKEKLKPCFPEQFGK